MKNSGMDYAHSNELELVKEVNERSYAGFFRFFRAGVFEIEIIDGERETSNLDFQVLISAPAGGAGLGPRDSATVTIFAIGSGFEEWLNSLSPRSRQRNWIHACVYLIRTSSCFSSWRIGHSRAEPLPLHASTRPFQHPTSATGLDGLGVQIHQRLLRAARDNPPLPQYGSRQGRFSRLSPVPSRRAPVRAPHTRPRTDRFVGGHGDPSERNRPVLRTRLVNSFPFAPEAFREIAILNNHKLRK